MKKPNPKIAAKAREKAMADKAAAKINARASQLAPPPKPLPHKVSLHNFYNKEIVLIRQWCEETLPPNTWNVSLNYPGWLYLMNEEDSTLFRLRWEK